MGFCRIPRTHAVIFSLASSVLYAFATLIQWRSLKQSPLEHPGSITLFSVPAVILHAYQLLALGSTQEHVIFSLLNTLSFIGLSLATVVIITSYRLPLHTLKLAAFPIAIITQLAAAILPPSQMIEPEIMSRGIFAHVALSMAAYAFLSLATLQALIIFWQNRELKSHRNSKMLKLFPPLQTNETILFELIWLGVIILSMAIIAGALYVDNLFTQHLAHKTILTLTSWLFFSLLLSGRYLWGWRGILAARLTVFSSILLMIGFLGSKFVLEYVMSGRVHS